MIVTCSACKTRYLTDPAALGRSEEHTSELQSHSDLHSFPTRRSSDLDSGLNDYPIGPDRACDDRHLFSVQDALPHRPGRAWRHRPDGAVREMRPYLDANAAGRPAAARGRDFARERPAGPGAAALQSARPLCPAAPPPVAPAHG